MTSLPCRVWRITILLIFASVATTALAQNPSPADAAACQVKALSGTGQPGLTEPKANAEDSIPTNAGQPKQPEQNRKPQPVVAVNSNQPPAQAEQHSESQQASASATDAPVTCDPSEQESEAADAEHSDQNPQKSQAADQPQTGQQQNQPPGQQEQGAAQQGAAQGGTPADAGQDEASKKKQTKRIFWILPNNRAVSADTQLPPLSAGGKLWLAAKDSFDYSSFLNVSILAAIGLAHNSTPQFHQGLKGYGTYFWHSWLDLADGNFMTEGVFPALTKQDPRFYTLGHGSFLRRASYAASRILVTRTDSGKTTFNFSEVAGNGAAAGIATTYYPASNRNFATVGKNWATQIGLDMLSYIFKEFWPDINHKLFHNHY